MSIKIPCTPAKGQRSIDFVEELMDWFEEHGGRPDLVGKHFPPGVRAAEHDNDVVAALYAKLNIMLLEFDDANLALLFKLRFGGK